MSAHQDAGALRDEAAKLAKEAARIDALAAAYPDLRKHTGRWKKTVYCSKSVNSLVNEMESRHNCGCCNDSPLEVWTFLETPNGRVYSDPPMFFVGERSYGGGDSARLGWEKSMTDQGIPESVVEKVRPLFSSYLEEDEED